MQIYTQWDLSRQEAPLFQRKTPLIEWKESDYISCLTKGQIMEIFCLHTPKTHFSKKGRRKKKWLKLIFDKPKLQGGYQRQREDKTRCIFSTRRNGPTPYRNDDKQIPCSQINTPMKFTRFIHTMARLKWIVLKRGEFHWKYSLL